MDSSYKEPVTTKYPKPVEVLWTRKGPMGYTTLVEFSEPHDSTRIESTEPGRTYLSVFTSHTPADSIVKAVEGACLGIVARSTEEVIAKAVEMGECY